MQLHAQCSRLAPATDTSEALGPFARVASQLITRHTHQKLIGSDPDAYGRETDGVRCISRPLEIRRDIASRGQKSLDHGQPIVQEMEP